ADMVVIAAGMFNFGMPSTLKTWIDHVTRAGLTFRYGDGGPVGLVQGKKVILVLAMGGVYSSGPMAPMNHLEPHLRTSLGFLGMTDIETVAIEGTAMGPEATEQAVAAARARAETLSVAAA
ncbi:MAG: NAD(P)H-dependent oxidoreductase, partial [Armatimonadota bacterium]